LRASNWERKPCRSRTRGAFTVSGRGKVWRGTKVARKGCKKSWVQFEAVGAGDRAGVKWEEVQEALSIPPKKKGFAREVSVFFTVGTSPKRNCNPKPFRVY